MFFSTVLCSLHFYRREMPNSYSIISAFLPILFLSLLFQPLHFLPFLSSSSLSSSFPSSVLPLLILPLFRPPLPLLFVPLLFLPLLPFLFSSFPLLFLPFLFLHFLSALLSIFFYPLHFSLPFFYSLPSRIFESFAPFSSPSHCNQIHFPSSTFPLVWFVLDFGYVFLHSFLLFLFLVFPLLCKLTLHFGFSLLFPPSPLPPLFFLLLLFYFPLLFTLFNLLPSSYLNCCNYIFMPVRLFLDLFYVL